MLYNLNPINMLRAHIQAQCLHCDHHGQSNTVIMSGTLLPRSFIRAAFAQHCRRDIHLQIIYFGREVSVVAVRGWAICYVSLTARSRQPGADCSQHFSRSLG